MNIYDITFKMCKKKSVGMVLMGLCDRGGGGAKCISICTAEYIRHRRQKQIEIGGAI